MWKQFKEEFLMIPVLLIVAEVMRQLCIKYFPEAGTFMPEAEVMIYVVKLWQMLWITSGVWLLLRIVFPNVYKNLVELSQGFDKLHKDDKNGYSVSLFIAFLIAFVLLFNGAKGNPSNLPTREAMLRSRLCDTLTKQLYVRELTGNNDGVEVERYLKSVGAKKGNSWCAAYVSYNLTHYKIANPNSAWSPSFANVKYKTQHAHPGDVFTLYYRNLKRVGHVGFIVDVTHGYYRTNEGNTGGSGVREGDGVHSYLRNSVLVYQVSDYISPIFKHHLKGNEKAINTIGHNWIYAIELQNEQTNLISTGEQIRHQGQYLYSCGSDLQGYFDYCICRQYNECAAFNYKWHSGATNNRNGSCAIESETSGVANGGGLFVQGTRVTSEASGKNNFSLSKKIEAKGIFANGKKRKNNSDTNTLVCENAYVDRRGRNFVFSVLDSEKNIF